ncbi:hypothetical protein [Streptomyces sp. NPDC050504]|uniref:hypothetical protein n=1 Tax=Streptomyces sp. NPDC050504 TaxID=3365618 RepID=UPI0037A646A0
MVSAPHEALHRIFQEYPEVFTQVSRTLGLDFPAVTSATVLSPDLTEARPVERRVDTLLRIETEADEPFLLAVESQGRKAHDKPVNWAYYIAYLHAKYELPAVLLVVCQDRATAEWAARPVRLGPRPWRTMTLYPLVAGPHNMPVITDPEQAGENLVMATLAAMTHARDPQVGAILKALSTALRKLPDNISYPLAEFTAQGLGKLPAAHQWRNLMAVDLSFYTSEIWQEARSEARSEGRVEGRAEDVLRLLDRRGIDVSDEQRERVMSCADLDVLGEWFDRAVTAATADEVFAGE